MQGCGPDNGSPCANTAATTSGTAETRILILMTLTYSTTGPDIFTGLCSGSVKKSGYRRVDMAAGVIRFKFSNSSPQTHKGGGNESHSGRGKIQIRISNSPP